MMESDRESSFPSPEEKAIQPLATGARLIVSSICKLHASISTSRPIESVGRAKTPDK